MEGNWFYEQLLSYKVTPHSAEQLLIYKLGDGWGPLCTHLDVPAPDIPYPNSNSISVF